MKCFQKSCPGMLGFSSVTLSPFKNHVVLSLSLTSCVALSQLLDLWIHFSHLEYESLGQESLQRPTSSDSAWRMLTLISS